MPSIADHWVRLSDKDLRFILETAPDQEDDTLEEYVQRLDRWINKAVDLIEDGLETW